VESTITINLAAGWTRVWNDEQKVPYAYHGDQWVGYDDLQSIEIKVKYLRGLAE
jgi:chitinase